MYTLLGAAGSRFLLPRAVPTNNTPRPTGQRTNLNFILLAPKEL